MPRKSPYKIVLADKERRDLERIASRYTSAYCTVVRAKAILLAARGLENKQIGERLDMPRQVVSKWRKRFFEHGLAGLEDLPRHGRPHSFPPSDHR